MFKQIALSILVFALMLNIAFCQNPSSFKFTTDDGLPHQTVFKVFQASSGYIWFATGLGVSRYDGTSFENFVKLDNLSSNVIIDIFEDSNNRIWFVGDDNTLSYLSNNKFIQFQYNEIANLNLPTDYPTKVEYRNDNSIIYSFSRIGNVIIDSVGEITIKPDFSRKVWKNLKTADRTYYWKKNKVIVEHHIGLKVNFDFSYNISDIVLDKDKNLIIGTNGKGIKIFEKENLKLEPKTLLKGENISSILIDKEEGIWASTISSGIYYFPAFYISLLDSYSFHNLKLNTATVHNDRIIKGHKDGIIQIINTSGSVKRLVLPDSSDVLDIYFDKHTETIIALTTRSVFAINNNKVSEILKLKKKNISRHNVRNKNIVLDKSGNYWVYNKHKLICFNNTKIINEIDLTFSKLKINVFSINNNSILLGTENGLWEYKNDSLYYKGNENELFSEEITSVYSDDKLFVLGTIYSGIIVCSKDTVYQFRKKDGLVNNIINYVDFNKNILWVSTNQGLSKIYLNKNYIIDNVETYTETTGLISNRIQKTITRDSLIYIVSNKGINQFNYINNTINKNKPIVIIKNIIANSKKTEAQYTYNLKHNNSSFVVDFIGINYKSMSGMRYFYKLENFDIRWRQINNASIIYHSLPPGDYILKIEAQSINNIFSDPTEIIIRVDKPFWLTWTFRIIFVSFIILSTYIFFTYRSKYKRRKNKIQKDIDILQYQALNKQMNPHFIFNSLNSIQNYILQNDVKNSSKYLNKFSMLIRMVLNNSQHQLVSIKKDTEALGIYMELESNRFKDRFEFNIEVKDEIDIYVHKIPPLIIQPFVENAIWHGLMNQDKDFEGKVTVCFKLENKRIICRITDNGVGRKKAGELNKDKQKNKSLGTKITDDRKNLINALNNADISIKYLDLHDNNNKATGTEVIINFPVFI